MNWLTDLWNRTIFPDMIEKRKEEKQQQKQLEMELRKEAREQALKEAKPIIVERMKQEEINRLTGQGKSDKLKKIGEAFSKVGQNVGTNLEKNINSKSNNTLDMEDKIKRMLK
jgi:hypothetical protein